MKKKKITSFRIDETILEKLKNGAAGAGIDRTAFLTNLFELNEDVSKEIHELHKRSIFPINLTNIELKLIIEEFISKLQNPQKIQVNARKSHGDKGISFTFDLEYSDVTEDRIKTVTFSINPDFEIGDYFVHNLKDELSSSINDVRLNAINYIVKNIYNEKEVVRDINTSITEEWSLLYFSTC